MVAATDPGNPRPRAYRGLIADGIGQNNLDGITSGCGGGNYCPDAAVTRAQMAVFLVRTFGL